MVQLPSTNKLPVNHLAASFGNVTNSYKFYWFLAILESVKLGHGPIISVDALLAQMIVSVWYPIHSFRLSFGKQDQLSQIANELKSQAQGLELDVNAKQEDVRQAVLRSLSMKSTLAQEIRNLGKYVPQRFLRPFFQAEMRGVKDSKANSVIEALAERDFKSASAPSLYRFVEQPLPAIELHPTWLIYLQDHLHVLTGFCLWHLVNYLQRNNQNVPNIPGKLFRPEQSKLTLAKSFWRLALAQIPNSRCIYSQVPITPNDFSIDHFLPWSFVAHDLLWNLVPTPKAVNSSKNDQLPDMTRYFDAFAHLQFEALHLVAATPKSDRLVEDYSLLFRRDSLVDLLSISESDFKRILRDTVSPQIQIAQNMGFAANWIYRP